VQEIAAFSLSVRQLQSPFDLRSKNPILGCQILDPQQQFLIDRVCYVGRQSQPSLLIRHDQNPHLRSGAGEWCYLYRPIEFFLSAFRDLEAAKSLFSRALRNDARRQPRVINTDLAPTYSSAICELQRTGVIRKRRRHRPVHYLNNIIEQDRRSIKRRINAKQGFRAFAAARRTIQEYEAVKMIREGQIRWIVGTDVRRQIQFLHNIFGIST
jgi:hypothetical protein